MTEYKFSNNAEGQLSVAIGTGDTTLNLNTGEGAEFPSVGAGEAFMALIYDSNNTEWVTCTAISGDQLTVTRSGAPSAFNIGAYVVMRLESTALDNFLQKGTERIVTSDPDGSLAADFTGEEVYQSITGVWWKHCTALVWKSMNV